MAEAKNRVCLVVIDGWGISNETKGNAILNAKTPVMDELCVMNSHPIQAHGLHVGLPEGLMGNSEVGHLNIGAGRVVYQDIVRINLAVKNKTLVENKHLKEAAERAIKGNGRMHLCGLVSDGGVHSHIDHLFALITALKQLKVPKLYIQFFGDGRDTSPTSGVGFLQQLIDFVNKEQYGEISTIVGRYYAMDRDKRWERIRVCYDALIGGVGEKTTIDKAIDVIKGRYAKDETDEFLKPIILSDEGRTKDGDTLIFFDYRADRMREITECMGMERYKDLNSNIKHPKNMRSDESVTERTDEQIRKKKKQKNMRTLHSSSNGGVEKQFANEERCLVVSPKVATYDLEPPMSSAAVADKVIKQLHMKKHPFVMCNFAPPDMVGHTGVYEAAVKAVEATDIAIGRIYEACKKNDYILMVTADHGNAEKMMAPDGSKHTAHTCNLVPFTCSSMKYKFMDKLPDREMALCDVAPTVLKVMGVPLPSEMTGQPLVNEA
uniref:phosphoglycerate mutase (2,3-diphosphoglycerate-independent) n=1 Tax=Brugia malayi TaxID=6279 RepID=Q4VWF7_BRUMA|nr:independent phosphoglycerate mutase isoform 2 [Brugia malayi]